MDSGLDGLDQISRDLLQELQQDARASYAELGRRVGLSPSAAAERVRRLEDEGVIRGYRVDIDPKALGYEITVFTRLVCNGDKYKQFVAFIKNVEAVRECYHITGSDAVIMKLLARSIEELDQLVLRLLAYGVPNSSVVLSHVLSRNGFDLTHQNRDPANTACDTFSRKASLRSGLFNHGEELSER